MRRCVPFIDLPGKPFGRMTDFPFVVQLEISCEALRTFPDQLRYSRLIRTSIGLGVVLIASKSWIQTIRQPHIHLLRMIFVP